MRVMSIIRRVGGWLAISGLLVAGSVSYADYPQEPEQFRILTYNVYTVLGAPGIDSRIDLMAASADLRGYDVIILNELFNDRASERLLAALSADYPYQTPVVGRGNPTDPNCAANDCWNSTEQPPNSAQRPEDGGVAILSRWPVQVRRQVIYNDTCSVDALAKKGFAYVQIDIDGQPVHIIGTHLEADPSPLTALSEQIGILRPCPDPASIPPDPACPGQSQTPYAAARLAQVRQMAAWIAQLNIPADQMVLIGGDMNVDKTGSPDEYERMLCTLNVSAPIFGGPPEMPRPRYTYDGHLNALIPADEASLYIDYLLVRRDHAGPSEWHNDVIYASAYPDNWDGGSASGYELSDHFPVAGYITGAPVPTTTRCARDILTASMCDDPTCYGPCPPGFSAAGPVCYGSAN